MKSTNGVRTAAIATIATIAALVMVAAARGAAQAETHAGTPVVPLHPAPSAMPPIDTAGDALLRWVADDTDGSRFVWATFRNVGLAYGYVTVAAFPSARGFVEVREPQPGDVVWWPAFMAVANPQGHSAVTADGEVDLGGLERRYGRPRFYRRLLSVERPLPGVGS